MYGVAIRSGGQTGVDRAALDVAIRLGLHYGGWCPRGGLAADFPEPPGLLARYPRLTETPSAALEQRTAWNVRDSHATLILVPGGDLSPYRGTAFTVLCADVIFLRPWLGTDVNRPEAPDQARQWLRSLMHVAGPEDLLLNVAGPRESEAPGVYSAAVRFLDDLLGGLEEMTKG